MAEEVAVKEDARPLGEEDGGSDFGAGFIYPLALFLAHADGFKYHREMYKEARQKNPGTVLFSDAGASEMWLYGAADHLGEFDPEKAPEELRPACRSLLERAMRWRMPMGGSERGTADQIWELVSDAKAIFFDQDRLAGHVPVKARWS